MRAPTFLLIVSVAAGAASCARSTPPSSGSSAVNRPNVLLVTIDTLRADAIGAYGHPRAGTPWMDRIAAAGVRFDRAHAHNVVTLPSHANILSGLYPIDHGVRDNAGFRFPEAVPTLATRLKERGYATAAFISAFPLASRFGLVRGFDVYEDSFVDAVPRTPLLEQERPGVVTVALARRWLDAHAGEPTFTWVHLFEPHAPYARNDYAADVAAADAALEPLLAPVLSGAGTGRTVVVLTADHGEALGEHGEQTHGVFAYEATLRVPLIVLAPGISGGRVVSTPARHVDIAPTILHAVGAPADPALRGRSLLADGGSSDDISYFESLSPALNRGWAPLRGVMRGASKYIDLPVAELYDITADPAEQRNLASTRQGEVRDLRTALARFDEKHGAASRVAEHADAAARLRSLGYTTGAAALRERYSEADDPKRLMGLDARLQEAVRLHTGGQRAHALAVARGVVAERPDMRVGWMTLAQIQRDGRDLEGAIASMRRALALAPEDAQTLSLLGAYLTERGRAAEAIALLSPAAARPQADLQVLVTLGLAQAQAGRGDEAQATIERARAGHPSNSRLLVELGTVQLAANRRDAARRTFELAVQRNPGLARAYSSLAAIHVEDGRDAEAIAAWREAARLDAGEYGRIFLLGIGLARAQKTGPARTCLSFFAGNAPPGPYAREIAAARAWLAGQVR
ncbi:MAG TPA: sulfatase-like hydrolase/transferase [Vicinamibacterales bacterium]|nr:sulfatase-like hydrolase/transferase [Vicinamibacterales bacterium]